MKQQNLQEFRKTLPTYAVRSQLLETILHGQNRVTIICSATGSGKSTQIPQYIQESNPQLNICVTQPRRVAAISIAERVSLEVGCKCGDKIGYAVRFAEKTSVRTRITYCTDGIAVRNALMRPNFDQTDVFIVDEAHERSVQTDILLGLLKSALKANEQLRVVVMSATIDTSVFANYFSTNQILFVQGKMFPVRHQFLCRQEQNYLEAISLSILQIHETKPPGDILVFLPGEREIQIVSQTVPLINKGKPLEVLQLFANLSQEDQMKVFQPSQIRRVICATNIAETSLTVPNVTYVIDSGFARQKIYDPQTQIQKLLTIPASKSSIQQRCGRAGRVCEGEAFHMYGYEAYEQARACDVCEVLRTDLQDVYLMLVGCGVGDVLGFAFVNQPSNICKKQALANLLKKNLLELNGERCFKLTDTGRKVVQLPLSVDEALCIIIACDFGKLVTQKVTALICILNSVEQFFINEEDSTQNRVQFRNGFSDHLMLLNIWDEWVKSENKNEFCRKFGVHNRTLQYVQNVHKQVSSIVEKMNIIIENSKDSEKEMSPKQVDEAIMRALCKGFNQNIARISKDDRTYEKCGTTVRIHPSSGVRGGKVILYHQIVQTTDNYMRIVTAVEEAWVQ